MSSKVQEHLDDQVASKQLSSRPPVRDAAAITEHAHPANIIRRARFQPGSLTPRDVLRLQRAIGNRAAQQLLRRAESADIGARSGTEETTHPAHDFSRMPVRAKSPVSVQPKLSVSSPGDTYEQEADRVSERVMRMPEPQLQRACACGEGCPECQAQQPSQGPERLQTKHTGSGDVGQETVPPNVHEVLRSPGQPLDAADRSFMETRFGHDFSHVRVHADAKASESARAVSASAYTVGRDVVFGVGQYAPGTTTGRGLLAHELTHVIQQGAPGGNSSSLDAAPQGLNGAVLQRKLVTESAGGCGLCKEARFVGSEVHTLVQALSFPPNVRTEFPIGFDVDEENGDMDGRLDLLEVNVDSARRTIEAYIGEIKPNNYRGIKAGMRDLAFYKQAVYDFFKGAFPDHAVTVESLDMEPNPAILPYAETQGCPEQAVEVQNVHDGLYLYNCAPTKSQLAAFKKCCKDTKEDEETVGDVVLVGSQLSSLLDDKKKDSQPEQKTEKQQAASSGSSSMASRVARLAARATLVGRIAEAHLTVYGKFASWAYTSVYEGTRGYNLNERLSELAEQVEPLSNVTAAALILASDLAMMEDIADSEEETAGVRAELTRYMSALGTQVYRAGRALEFARSYSAVAKRIDLSEGDQYALFLDRSYELRTGLGVSLDKTSDNDAFSLSIVIEYEAGIAEWLLTQIENVLKDYEGVINDDQSAWLDHRP